MMYYRPGEGAGFVFLMNAEPRGGRFEEVLARRLLEFAQEQLAGPFSLSLPLQDGSIAVFLPLTANE